MNNTVYSTLKAARQRLSLDVGFDPFLHGGARDRTGKLWRKPTKAALGALGYLVIRKKEEVFRETK